MACSWLLECLLLLQFFLHAHLIQNNKLSLVSDASQSNFKCRLPSSSDKLRVVSQAQEILGYNWIHATRSSSHSATILSFQNDSLYVYPQLLSTQPCSPSNASACYCLFRLHTNLNHLYVPLEPSPTGAHRTHLRAQYSKVLSV